jgi:hypothetical protein
MEVLFTFKLYFSYCTVIVIRVPELLRQRIKLGACWDTGNVGDEAQDMADSVSSFTYKKPHYGAWQGHPDADLCWPLWVCVKHTDFSSCLAHGCKIWEYFHG